MKNDKEREDNIDSFNSSKFTKSESKTDINNKKLDLKNGEEKVYNINEEFKIGKNNKKPNKNVNISDNIHIIQVECWKKYNLEQSVEPNINFFGNQNNLNNGDINKEENNDSNKNIKRNSKADVKCSCLII